MEILAITIYIFLVVFHIALGFHLSFSEKYEDTGWDLLGVGLAIGCSAWPLVWVIGGIVYLLKKIDR